MRLSPTRIESFSGSARSPSFAAFPLTNTRPSRIHSSASRREAIPACARIFWIRTPEISDFGFRISDLGGTFSILRVSPVVLVLVVLVVLVELFQVLAVEVVVADAHRGGRRRGRGETVGARGLGGEAARGGWPPCPRRAPPAWAARRAPSGRSGRGSRESCGRGTGFRRPLSSPPW